MASRPAVDKRSLKREVDRRKDLPIFGPKYANCEKCELKENCDRGKVVTSWQPKNFNGIMVVGEGPGKHEVIEGRPFVGASGKLLRAIFESEGADLDECYVTNATSCLPPPGGGDAKGDKKGFHDRFPNAVYSCLPRLEAEIAAVRPRVIIAVGAAAMIALTGYEEKHQKRRPFTCDNCDPKDRKVGPVIECSAKNDLNQPCKARYWADEAPETCTKQDVHGRVCGAKLGKQRPKRVKCPVCHGLKTRTVEETSFEYDYKISEVAGAVITDKQHTWGSLGVKYIIPTIHPSALLRPGKPGTPTGQFMAKAVQKHIRKAIRLSKTDEDWGFEYELTTGESDREAAEHLLEYIYDVKDGSFERKDPIFEFSVDIETEAWNEDHTVELDARKLSEVSNVTCIGFASYKKGWALVVDTREMLPNGALHKALRRVLTDEQTKKCFHNGAYDVPVINKLWGIRVAGYEDDTLIQHHVLYPDEPHKLSHLAFCFTYASIWKPPKNLKGREAHESFEDLAKYNARDVMITDETKENLRASLVRHNMKAVYDLDMGKLQKQALAMHFNGMPVQRESAQKVGQEALEKANRGLNGMRNALGLGPFDPANPMNGFDPNKPAQLRDALFTKLGFPQTALTTTGLESVAMSELKRLPDHPFRTALIEYAGAFSILKAYYAVDARREHTQPSKGLTIWSDGRVHPTWKPFGTRTGRFSSSPNFQNIPKWFRALIKATPGRKIFGADYDQLELRILAALSGDEILIDKCLSADDTKKLDPDWDPHSYVALNAFGQSYVQLNMKDPLHDKTNTQCRCETCSRKALRDLCKRVIYGLNYGAGDEKVLESIYDGGYEGPPITLTMIARVRKAIFTAFKGILPYQNRLVKEANQNGYVNDAIIGRKRHFPLGDIPVTEIKNYIIQSTGASIINLRNTLLFEGIQRIDPTAMYIAQVHDAVYYDIDEKKASLVEEFAAECLTWKRSLYEGGPVMVFSASGTSADDWKSAA